MKNKKYVTKTINITKEQDKFLKDNYIKLSLFVRDSLESFMIRCKKKTEKNED